MVPLSRVSRTARIRDVYELPRLIEVQLDSFRWFQTEGLEELFNEISPIVSFNKNLELHFGSKLGPDGFWFGEPKYQEPDCRDRDMTYAAPLWVRVKLVNRETGEVTAQNVFMGDFPLMTENGTFIINGAERVVVSQLIRSPGVYFTVEEDRVTDRRLCFSKMIPNRGAWLEFESSKRDLISVKVDRKRKLPVTVLLRAIGYGSDEEILELFTEVDNEPEHVYIATTLERDPTRTANRADSAKGVDAALLEFYKKLRPGDPPTLDNAKSFMQNLVFAPRRYDLGKVGRYKLNRRLDLTVPLSHRTLTNEDLVAVVRKMIQINNGVEGEDDIDHLGNRRVKTVGELIQNQLRIGLLRMERVVRERMSIRDNDQTTPLSLINIRPVVAAIREFFGGSQLSQFMDQTNPLAELTHKRRLERVGPGRSASRACGLRCARRAQQPLRPHLPDRDAGRPEHRSHRLVGHLWQDQRVRLHRDAVPEGAQSGEEPARRAGGQDPARAGLPARRHGSGAVRHRGRRTTGRAHRADGRCDARSAHRAGSDGRDQLPVGRRGRPLRHRAGERAHR